MSGLSILLLASVCFVAMVSPGPDFILVTRSALTLPKTSAMATALGIVCGCLVHASYCVLGLAVILTQSIVLFSLVKYVGAVYLIYIGIQAFRSTSPNSSESTEVLVAKGMVKRASTTPGHAFAQGFLCNLLNPKLAMFLLSLFTQFIAPNAGMVEKGIVASVFVLESALYWPIVVIALQSKGVRKMFDHYNQVLDRVCGVVLVGIGLRVAVSD